MAEPAIGPFADGANPFRGPVDSFANGTVPFGPPGGSWQATIDMLQSALIARAYVGKKLGDKVLHAAEEAGLKRIKQLRVEAVLNPDLALALMKEAPKQPNRDAAAILALRLRQMSMAGILTKQQH